MLFFALLFRLSQRMNLMKKTNRPQQMADNNFKSFIYFHRSTFRMSFSFILLIFGILCIPTLQESVRGLERHWPNTQTYIHILYVAPIEFIVPFLCVLLCTRNVMWKFDVENDPACVRNRTYIKSKYSLLRDEHRTRSLSLFFISHCSNISRNYVYTIAYNQAMIIFHSNKSLCSCPSSLSLSCEWLLKPMCSVVFPHVICASSFLRICAIATRYIGQMLLSLLLPPLPLLLLFVVECYQKIKA